MTLKDDLLHFIGAKDNAAPENDIPPHTALMDGLCVICENRPHCVWVENTKIYCEHYE